MYAGSESCGIHPIRTVVWECLKSVHILTIIHDFKLITAKLVDK